MDFYCPSAKLVIELDGPVHLTVDQQEYDQVRVLELKAMGLKIIRFNNDKVGSDLDGVLKRIVASTL